MYEIIVEQSLYIYLFLLALIIIFGFTSSGNNNFYFLTLTVGILTISSLRYGVGYDFYSYLDAIKYSSDRERFELIPKVIIELSRAAGREQLFFVVTSFFIYGLIAFSFHRYSSYRLLSLIFFISYPLFFLISLGVVRQYLAVSFIVLGVCILINESNIKKKALGVFLVIFAVFCHLSAVLVLPILFFVRYLKYNYSIFLKVTFIFFSFILSDYLVDLVVDFYPYYGLYLEDNSDSGYKIMVVTVILYLISTLSVNKSTNKNVVAYDNLFFIGVCLYISLIGFGTAPARASIFFVIFSCFSLPQVINFVPRGKTLVRISFIIFSSLLFLSSIYFASINPERDPLLPYVFFFEK